MSIDELLYKIIDTTKPKFINENKLVFSRNNLMIIVYFIDNTFELVFLKDNQLINKDPYYILSEEKFDLFFKLSEIYTKILQQNNEQNITRFLEEFISIPDWLSNHITLKARKITRVFFINLCPHLNLNLLK